jgi:predicted phage terminase large subunit-like protein
MLKHDDYVDAIRKLPQDRQDELLALLEELSTGRQKENARHFFLPFVKTMWPGFIEGTHHKIIAELFDEVVQGKKSRVIINMPPRHTKSEFASIHLPAFYLGRYPDRLVIQASNTAELAVSFGRKVRNLIDRKDFQQLFPGIALSADSKAAGRWATNKNGEYFAIGAGGTVSGKGAHLLIIDDPHSEQDAVIGETNPEVYQRLVEWYETGPRQRLQPGGAIIVVQTRWSLRDLTGSLIKKQQADVGSDQWEVVELPAILPSGNPIWPEFWKLEELLRTKASIPISRWNAQYQQNPISEEGALIKRDYWKNWDKPKAPKCESIIQSWDTAFSNKTRSDYSACTTWGVFIDEEEEREQHVHKLILLDAIRGKWEFPELKKQAKKHYEEWEPDICLIEARAAGHPLIYELRQMNIPIQEIVVGRGGTGNPNDKISRVNSITDIFSSGMVYAAKIKSWAQEVIEECAAFPAGEHDDYVDTVTMAMQRFRLGGWIGTSLDDDDDRKARVRRPMEYY